MDFWNVLISKIESVKQQSNVIESMRILSSIDTANFAVSIA